MSKTYELIYNKGADFHFGGLPSVGSTCSFYTILEVDAWARREIEREYGDRDIYLIWREV